ncbi:MAG: hypothetical protein IPH20_15730 [Bacteroidales bacterium]|nr:hypothetical protein [Bacteroidales bacterium]
MKKVRLFIPIALVLLFLLGLSSCMVATRGSSGNDAPKGWYKNSNNPHHPNSTNPGKGHTRKNKKKPL